jgi:hypothetical protein
MRNLASILASAVAAALVATTPAHAETGAQKLDKLLRPHAFLGQRVTDDVRAATGEPNIIVIDRRWIWGEIYSCNYQFLGPNRTRRALVCD